MRTRGVSGRNSALRPVVATVVLSAVALAAGCSETGPVGGEQAQADPGAGDVMAAGGYEAVRNDGPVIERFPGANWFHGELPAEAKKADPDATPVKVGFIGINDGPIAALPELLQATETAVKFVNAELGGVDGHPIELVPCSVSLSPESSQRCARCNGLLAAASKQRIWERLPPETRRYIETFWECGECGHLYWEGSHMPHIRRFIDGPRARAGNDMLKADSVAGPNNP